MDDLKNRLIRCFQTVFPSLPDDSVERATPDNLKDWDSVAAITLVTVIDEEFGTTIDLEDLPSLDSFENIRQYLQSRLPN